MAFLPEIKAEHVAMTCGTIVAVFQGENQQCNDFDACVDFVNAIPLGNWDLACRKCEPEDESGSGFEFKQ